MRHRPQAARDFRKIETEGVGFLAGPLCFNIARKFYIVALWQGVAAAMFATPGIAMPDRPFDGVRGQHGILLG